MPRSIPILTLGCALVALVTLEGFSAGGQAPAAGQVTAAWAVQAMPGSGSPVEVSCPSTTSCAAIGSDRVNPKLDSLGTRAWRWNGTRWSTQAIPNPAAQSKLRPSEEPQGASLTGLSCPSAKACIAVGSFLDNSIANPKSPGSPGRGVTLAERWNGKRWSIQPTANPARASRSSLSEVDCTSPSACIAVGYFVNRAGDVFRTLAERWDGSSWSIQSTPNAAHETVSELSGVSCWSSTACIAVGKLGSGLPLAERWNGTRWTIQPIPRRSGAASVTLASVACTSASSCIAVGPPATDIDPTSTDTDTRPVVERWNGRRWSIQHAPGAFNGQDSTFADVSCAASNACTAVGSWLTTVDGLGGGGGSLADRWNGVSWAAQPVVGPSGATDSGLVGVACPTKRVCVAVGAFTNSAGGTVPFAERYL